jgi:hypothetical protein
VGAFAGPDGVESGLVLALDAGNSKSYPGSGTTWTDLSGRGNNGTLTNMEIPGDYLTTNGGFFDFDGSNERIALGTPSALQFSSSFTIDIWFRMPVRQIGTLISYGDSSWMLYLEPSGVGTVRISLAKSKVANDGSLLRFLPDANVWHHDVCVFTNTASPVLHYFDGTLYSVGNVGSAFSFSNTLNIGYADNEGYYFPGDIASVKLYNRALTASEARQNYLATKSRYGL